MLKKLQQEKLKMLIKINFSSYQNKIIMKKIILFLLFINIIFSVKSQVLIKPNGDVIARPNLQVVKPANNIKNVKNGTSINAKILTDIQGLKVLGKSYPDIAKQLKVEKFTATQIYQSFKITVPDYENISALCYAGFTINEIAEALKLDGKTAMECVDLLKNSTGCTFVRSEILSSTRKSYNLTLIDLVPIIQAKYTTDRREIVRILYFQKLEYPEVISAIKYYNFASNRTELCALLDNSFAFGKEFTRETFQKIRHIDFPVLDQEQDIAAALISINCKPLEILQEFRTTIYGRKEINDAIKLAKLAKFMNMSRDETAKFLRRDPFTAAQILDALQAAYN